MFNKNAIDIRLRKKVAVSVMDLCFRTKDITLITTN